MSRKKGSSLQAHSVAINGLPCVVVARPAKYSNPFKVGVEWGISDRATVVEKYRCAALQNIDAIRRDLRGKNLACWCELSDKCHADALLEIANGPLTEAAK